MKHRFIFGWAILLTLSGAAFFSWGKRAPFSQEGTVVTAEQLRPPQAQVPTIPETTPTLPIVPEPLPMAVLIDDVPFTVQAPFASWANPLFQDACEEASIIMAEAWVNQGLLTPEGVKAEIQALATFEKKHFGHAIDTSINDTAWLLGEYYGVIATVEKDIKIGDIQQAIALGKIVIVPTDGRKLKNPNFKQPGPARHMVVIIGYDTKTVEFIVNDPGTRKGKDYRYPEAVLYDAITDYATGDHAPVTSTDKVMLTVGRF
ncbi:MAG: C39 family peptidase [Candidatus Moranbacteria bacterium]|nr:C39 family peptidase [Candidatus Moranbacteria bacterium]